MKRVTAAVLGLFMSACGGGSSSAGTVASPSAQQASVSITLTVMLNGIAVSIVNGPFRAGVPGYFNIDVTPDTDRMIRLTINPGDGTGDLVVDIGANSGKQTVPHVYSAAGHYSGKLTVAESVASVSMSSGSSFDVTVY